MSHFLSTPTIFLNKFKITASPKSGEKMEGNWQLIKRDTI